MNEVNPIKKRKIDIEGYIKDTETLVFKVKARPSERLIEDESIEGDIYNKYTMTKVTREELIEGKVKSDELYGIFNGVENQIVNGCNHKAIIELGTYKCRYISDTSNRDIIMYFIRTNDRFIPMNTTNPMLARSFNDR